MPGIEKELMFKEINKTVKDKPYVFFAKFKKVSVADMGSLRRSLEKYAERCLVVKNTVARRVFTEMKAEDVVKMIDGQVLLTTAQSEPQEISKALVDFEKQMEGFELNGAFVEGTAFDVGYIKKLSKLPSREQLIADVVGGIKTPINNFVFILNGLLRNLVGVLDQIKATKNQ